MYGSITSNPFRSKKEESKGDRRGAERKIERVTLVVPPPQYTVKAQVSPGSPKITETLRGS